MKKSPTEMYRQVIEAISDCRNVTLTTHILPDGDAIGSLLGLALILRGSGKNVQASWGNRFVFPSQYAFLDGQDLLVPPDELPERPELLIILDCGSPERMGSLEKLLALSEITVNIDHHRNNTGYASINIISPTYASTSEMVYDLAKELGISIDKSVAENLYTGLVTDTGRFQYTNTTASSLETAAELVRIGVDPAKIFRSVYENTTFERLKLAGAALSNAAFDRDTGLIYTIITKKDFEGTNSSVEDTENLIDFLRAVTGVRIAAVLKETDAGWRVSLRSTGSIDVGLLAENRNGGGHRLAAGYTAAGSAEDALRDLRNNLETRAQ